MDLLGRMAMISLGAILVALPPWGCSSSDDDSSGAGGGVTSGGATTGGSSSHVGGATGGTVGYGGAPTTGGVSTAQGGAELVDIAARARSACSNWQAGAFVIGCTAAFADTYLDDCTAELVAAAASCQSEVVALLDCGTLLTVLEYACDADDNVTFADGVCEVESAALEQCTS